MQTTQQMTVIQAHQVLNEALSKINTTRQGHLILSTALNTLYHEATRPHEVNKAPVELKKVEK